MTSGAQTILITGATDGLGRALAHSLAAGGAALILHGRDPGKLERSGEPDGRTRRTGADGYELRFAVNYLAGFLLTLDLLPLLRRSAPARIVNVASIGQHPLDFADL